MSDEDAFLRKLLENPTDDTVRLVYADWLAEVGDEVSMAKAEFLRLICRPVVDSDDIVDKVRHLTAGLPVSWLGIVSKLKVENCKGKAEGRSEDMESLLARLLRFTLVCDNRWEGMGPTADPNVRFCDGCQTTVHYCHTIGDARTQAQAGNCVAVNLGEPRQRLDLSHLQATLGLIDIRPRDRDHSTRAADPAGGS